MRASATLATNYLTVVPGGEASVAITVRNSGDTVEAYQLDVVGVPAEWVRIEPAAVNVYPGGSESVTMTFAPPRSARVTAGERPFGVRVVPSEFPDSTVVEEGVLAIEPFTEIAARLRPASRAARRSARYRIDTDNNGNLAQTLGFAAGDGTDQLIFQVRPTFAEVGNGARAETGLRVKSRRWIWWGERREYPFAAEVRPDGRPPHVLDGVFIQKPIISATLLKVLAALLALVLALLALWFGLLRPVVRTAAREAADERSQQRAAQDTEMQTTPPDAAPGAAKPSTGAGKGSPADGGTGTGTGTGGTGGQQFSAAISFRTLPNGSAARSFTVPARSTFLLTDFLVDNVQGDEGTLAVTANGVTVVTYALENFRNQDYHSVTPIRVPAGAKVTMTVVCRRAGTPANARPAGTCREGLYLNGLMNKQKS
jgi:hypothetical protein